MKEMIKRVKENKGGFTLAELLIVVAIILVLVAIAIPVFTGAMAEANKAVAAADIRSVQAQATTEYMLKDMAKDTAKAGASYTAVLTKDGKVKSIAKDPTKQDATKQEAVIEALQGAGDITITVVVEPTDISTSSAG